MQILVTGGAGFIGGNLAEAFLRDGHDVTVVDNFEPFYDLGIKDHTVERCETVATETDGTYDLVSAGVLLGVAVVFLALSTVAFERRDI